MEILESFFKSFSNLLWGNWLIATLIGVGIYYTIMTRFIQIRKLPLAFHEAVIVPFKKKGKRKNEEGNLTPFQALCTALASCVGNGNIVGVATALMAGGPGAVFWMWVAGFVGMATKFGEIVLGMAYREKDENGIYVGGPMYYIAKGMKLPWLASIYAVFSICQNSGGALIQSNAVAGVVQEMFGLKPWVSAALLTFAVGLIVIGGIKRLGAAAEKLVPFMATFYIIGGLIVVAFNIKNLPYVFITIFKSAFTLKAGAAGAAGYTIREAIRFGVARGLYSNEAGEGSAPVLHASAITDHPVRQALYGTIEVFIDTIVISTITATVLIITGVLQSGKSPEVLTSVAFSTVHPLFKYVVGFSMILFAYSSIPAQWYFGNVGLTYLIGAKKASYFRYIFIWFIVIGSLSSLQLVWAIQDCLLGLLIIPNLIAMIYLSPQVFRLTKEFFDPANGYLDDCEDNN